MKKLLLIITASLILSCSTEDNANRLGEPLPNPTCECVKIEEFATSATNYTVWLPTGIIS